MSNVKQAQAKLHVPHRYRVRQVIPPAANNAEVEEASIYSLSTGPGEWTRGSRASSFIDGELGSTLGRWMRAGGRLVIDPIDNLIGIRELRRLDKYLDDLDYHGWRNLVDSFDAEGYAPRLIEVLRYPVYPRNLRLLAQKITLKLALLGQIRFDRVEPRIHFHSKDEFEDSINDLCATAITLIPKPILLTYLPINDDMDGFLSSLRREVTSAAESRTWPTEDHIIFQLALHIYQEGRRAEADALFLMASEARRRLQGEEYLDTMTSLINLALTYSSQGLWKEAEDLNLKVLEKQVRLLGEEHPDTLTTMDSLASFYQSRGRWKEAEKIQLNVLKTWKRMLGEEHPYTLNTMGSLASTYHSQGRLEKAAEIGMTVLDKMKAAVEGEHSQTLTTASLADTDKDQVDCSSANRASDEEGRDSDTRWSLKRLESIYRMQRRYKEADMVERWIETRKDTTL